MDLVALLVLAHAVGALASVQAIMETRTAQGAVAWVVLLHTMPYVAVPADWIFGRTKFNGYVKKPQTKLAEANPAIRELVEQARASGFLAAAPPGGVTIAERLGKQPATLGNDLELLRNGKEIFPSLLNRIAKSRPCSDATLPTPALPRLRNLKSAGSGCDSRCAWLASSPQSSEWADSIQNKSLRDTHL